MSFVLLKHQQHVIKAVADYKAKISEIEADIRLRAMSNDVSRAELALLRRLKQESAQTLYRYQNLCEAFKAVVDPLICPTMKRDESE